MGRLRRAVGPSGVGERPRTETREHRPRARGPVVSCRWASSDERSARYEEHRFVVGVAYGSYPCDDVQERAQNGGGDDADVGRAVVSFGSCFR
jgi:hypothetical protein